MKGEGITSYHKSICGKKRLILGPIFGKSHERPDLTAGKSCGYPWIVLCILGHEHRIIEQKDMCLKTYEEYVMTEIRQKRYTSMKAIKDCVFTSK